MFVSPDIGVTHVGVHVVVSFDVGGVRVPSPFGTLCLVCTYLTYVTEVSLLPEYDDNSISSQALLALVIVSSYECSI